MIAPGAAAMSSKYEFSSSFSTDPNQVLNKPGKVLAQLPLSVVP